MFDIHKIKPVHGWREFFGEVGIIVLGVLIAISAEQIMENLHWRNEVADGQKALRAELQDVVYNSMEREVFSKCLNRRLDELDAIVDRASTDGQLPPLGPIGGPPLREWSLPAWDSLVAAQIAVHFPRDQQLNLGDLDAYLRQIGIRNNDERTPWMILWTMVGPGRKLASGEESQIRIALSEARFDAKTLRRNASQLIRDVREESLLSKADFDDVYRTFRKDITSKYNDNPVCMPIGDPPSFYGTAKGANDLLDPLTGL